MPHHLRDTLYLCQIGEAYVSLDLATNRYGYIHGTSAGLIAAFLDGGADPETVRRLVANNIVKDGTPKPRYELEHLPDVVAGLEAYRMVRPSAISIGRAVIAHLYARRAVAARPISDLLARVAETTPSHDNSSVDACLDIAIGYRHARRYLSQDNQCLARSVALTQLLGRAGQRVHLVIGVMVPFAAHCWVQAGTTILSDDLDEVRPYRPILVL